MQKTRPHSPGHPHPPRGPERHDAPSAPADLELLREEHRQIELRLVELERHLSLTSEEQRERAELKKLKLLKKDLILSLLRGVA